MTGVTTVNYQASSPNMFNVKTHLKTMYDFLIVYFFLYLCNSYTMGCPPVRGDNPRALASRLSYVQGDKHGITILYTYISVDLAHHEIFHA